MFISITTVSSLNNRYKTLYFSYKTYYFQVRIAVKIDLNIPLSLKILFDCKEF